MPEHGTITLLDFGMGILAGLVRADQRVLDEAQLARVHQGMVEAFNVVDAAYNKGEVRFWMTTNNVYGTSPDVDKIFKYWLNTSYCTKDAPGTIYRFLMGRGSADGILDTLLGGAELYDKAVAVLLDHIRTSP